MPWKIVFLLIIIFSVKTQLHAKKDLSVDKGVFTLKCAPYQVTISKECKYTITSIKYKEYFIVPKTGYNGSVVLFKEPGSKLKICGVGHVNGGEEQILSFSLKADGKVIQPEEGQILTAKSFELAKVSMLANIRLSSRITISEKGIYDSRGIRSEAEQKLLFFYLYMYCLSPDTQEWTALLTNGTTMGGVFEGKNAFKLNRDVQWLAQFDPISGTGVLLYFTTPVKGKNKKNTFWDKKHYHKYYFILNTPPVLPKGYSIEEKTLIFKCFDADKKNWRQKINNLINDLKKNKS